MNRRQNIIDAAMKSFSMFGFKGTTVDQIARIANVGKGTIYTIFDNKEQLFMVSVEQLIDEMKEMAEKCIEPERSFFENLHRVLYGMLLFRKDHELLLQLSYEAKELGSQVAQEAMNQVEQEAIAFVRAKLLEAQENGKIAVDNLELAAFLMFKVYIALIFDWEKYHEPLSNDEIAAIFRRFIMLGLTEPTPQLK